MHIKFQLIRLFYLFIWWCETTEGFIDSHFDAKVSNVFFFVAMALIVLILLGAGLPLNLNIFNGIQKGLTISACKNLIPFTRPTNHDYKYHFRKKNIYKAVEMGIGHDAMIRNSRLRARPPWFYDRRRFFSKCKVKSPSEWLLNC